MCSESANEVDSHSIETSQWEPRLVENYNAVEPPHDDPKYHLTEDMVNKALAWIDDRQSYAPDRPFLMYWAPGAAHGPHHIFPEWADQYKGKFDDGWMACAFGPFYPWNTPASLPRLAKWDSATDEWELYDLRNDFSQANNLAGSNSARLAKLQEDFLALARDNKAFPIGAGNWLRLRPQDRVSTPYRNWSFTESTRRMPEFSAPGIGRESNVVEIDMECGADASGVLYALGGSGGGLTLYMDKGHIVYLYNMMIIEQYEARSAQPLAAGKHKIVVDTSIAGPGKEGTVVITVDDKEVGTTELKRTVPAAFTASESLDVGVDLGSTVADAYFERRPFKFDGQIKKVSVNLR